MLIRRTKDLVPVEIDGVTFHFKPLAVAEKTELMGLLGNNQTPSQLIDWTKAVISRALKKVEGLELADGSLYILGFDGDVLDNSTMDDLLNLPFSEKIMAVGGLFIKGVPQDGQVINPQSGEPMAGIVVKKN